MQNRVYYRSDAYTSEYSENKQSSFRSNIISQNLDYLPSGPLEVALVNLTITLKEKLAKPYQLGVRSSLPKVSSIRGSAYDKIIYTFTIQPAAKSKLTFNYEIPTAQHIYLQTTRENLEKATFQIIDLKENKVFTNIDNSAQATLIEVAVQPHSTMTTSNTMILSSDDSNQRITSNTNMNFTAYLPEQLNYQGQSWAVICKGLQTTGKIYNVQDDTFTLKYTKKKMSTPKISVSTDQTVHLELVDEHELMMDAGSATVLAGEYENIEHLVVVLNQKLKDNFMAGLSFQTLTKNKKMLLKSTYQDQDQQQHVLLTITPELSRILGYSKSTSPTTFNMGVTPTIIESDYSYVEGEDMDTSMTMILKQDYYKTRVDVLTALNKQLAELAVLARFNIPTAPTRTRIISNGSTTEESFTLSPKLAKMLGFTNVLQEEEYSVNLGTTTTIKAAYDEDLHVGLPSNLIVNMDVVQTQTVGNKHLPVLQTIFIDSHRPGPIRHFDFRENNQALLNIKLFSKVKITITDINGVPVKADPTYPTIIHLKFTRLA